MSYEPPVIFSDGEDEIDGPSSQEFIKVLEQQRDQNEGLGEWESSSPEDETIPPEKTDEEKVKPKVEKKVSQIDQNFLCRLRGIYDIQYGLFTVSISKNYEKSAPAALKMYQRSKHRIPPFIFLYPMLSADPTSQKEEAAVHATMRSILHETPGYILFQCILHLLNSTLPVKGLFSTFECFLAIQSDLNLDDLSSLPDDMAILLRNMSDTSSPTLRSYCISSMALLHLGCKDSRSLYHWSDLVGTPRECDFVELVAHIELLKSNDISTPQSVFNN